MSFSHGAVAHLADLAREAEVSRKTAQGNVEALEDLLLAYRVPVFARRAQRQLVAHPKLYLFDTGVFRALRPRGPLDRASEIEGPAREGLVAQRLRAWIAYSLADLDRYYWRTRPGVEVDFVLYGSGGFHAIEVKNAATVLTVDARGLQSFVADSPECTPTLHYRGAHRLRVGGVSCVPVAECLRELRPDRHLLQR